MLNRYAQALFIDYPGACNPIAIANQIVEAIKEVRNEPGFRGTASITGDPAVQLMVHQLAYITGMHDGGHSDNYNAALVACKERANADVVVTETKTHVLGKEGFGKGVDASDAAWQNSDADRPAEQGLYAGFRPGGQG